MYRKAFLALTGLSSAAYRGMIINGQIAWADRADGWANHTLEQALNTCVLVALAPHVGGLSSASSRLGEFRMLSVWQSIAPLDWPDTWAATFDLSPQESGWSVGHLPELFSRSSTLGPAIAITHCSDLLDSVVLLNLSRILRDVIARAEAYGVLIDIKTPGERREAH